MLVTFPAALALGVCVVFAVGFAADLAAVFAAEVLTFDVDALFKGNEELFPTTFLLDGVLAVSGEAEKLRSTSTARASDLSSSSSSNSRSNTEFRRRSRVTPKTPSTVMGCRGSEVRDASLRWHHGVSPRELRSRGSTANPLAPTTSTMVVSRLPAVTLRHRGTDAHRQLGYRSRSSRCSHARATCQSASTVRGAMPSMAAVSSTVSPPK